MKTFQSNSAENFSWGHGVNARLPGKMAGASPKLLVLLRTGMWALGTRLSPESSGRLVRSGALPLVPEEGRCHNVANRSPQD